MKYFLVDTNVIIDYPNIFEKEENLVVPLFIIEELDELKRADFKDLAKNARRASNFIKKYRDKILFETCTLTDLYACYADDGLVALAKKKNYSIITNDINLQIKCEIKKIDYKEYSPNREDYSGILRLQLEKDSALISEIYEGNLENLTASENQYIIIKEGETVREVFKKQEEGIKRIDFSLLNSPYEVKSTYLNKVIRPRNIEQVCLMDSLFSSSSIVCALGPFGSGKSFLMANYAIQQLEDGKIDKIVYIPNNSQNDNTEDLGALPGTALDKEMPYMGTLIDILGLDNILRLYEGGVLEILPLNFARGRNIENSIIFVNEAQNLTEDHVKLLIGRVAEGTRIFFDGDIKQTDKKIFKDKNGLKLLLRLHESEEFASIFSVVRLEKTERSKAARAAQYLEDIQ